MQAGSDRDYRTNHRPKHYLIVTHTHIVALILTGLFNTHQSYVLFLLLNANQKVTKESLRDKICSPPRSQGYWTAALGLLFCEQHCH